MSFNVGSGETDTIDSDTEAGGAPAYIDGQLNVGGVFLADEDAGATGQVSLGAGITQSVADTRDATGAFEGAVGLSQTADGIVVKTTGVAPLSAGLTQSAIGDTARAATLAAAAGITQSIRATPRTITALDADLGLAQTTTGAVFQAASASIATGVSQTTTGISARTAIALLAAGVDVATVRTLRVPFDREDRIAANWNEDDTLTLDPLDR